jgi:hypothetical protein
MAPAGGMAGDFHEYPGNTLSRLSSANLSTYQYLLHTHQHALGHAGIRVEEIRGKALGHRWDMLGTDELSSRRILACRLAATTEKEPGDKICSLDYVLVRDFGLQQNLEQLPWVTGAIYRASTRGAQGYMCLLSAPTSCEPQARLVMYKFALFQLHPLQSYPTNLSTTWLPVYARHQDGIGLSQEHNLRPTSSLTATGTITLGRGSVLISKATVTLQKPVAKT